MSTPDSGRLSLIPEPRLEVFRTLSEYGTVAPARIWVEGGLVRASWTDPGFGTIWVHLLEDGAYHHGLKRAATVDDGYYFLEAVQEMFVNSSYWAARRVTA